MVRLRLKVGGLVEEELIGEFLERVLGEVHLSVGLPLLGRREERVYDQLEGLFDEVWD